MCQDYAESLSTSIFYCNFLVFMGALWVLLVGQYADMVYGGIMMLFYKHVDFTKFCNKKGSSLWAYNEICAV